jgi:ornithine cyclodeaminase
MPGSLPLIRAYTADDVHRALDWVPLAEALARAFAAGAEAPARHVHDIGGNGRLLVMPAWTRGAEAALGVKLVTVQPDNAVRSVPTVHAIYVLFDGATAAPMALIDGEALTLRRTAAMSALAARHLARREASVLLVIGTGALAPFMARAHVALRPAIKTVRVWGRNAQRATALADQLRAEGLPAEPAPDLAVAVRDAHIVSCATTAAAPVVQGVWLSAGTHLDLVGGFTRAMREADDDAVRSARIAVDSYAGALAEAGDLTDPMERGVIRREQIVAELAQLVRGEVPGRTGPEQVTVFKSVGTALADLAAAQRVVR